ncbi:eEF1-gamma domain-containing protein [Athelia psychrophila]|uniref:EEF1-gamma domain-containing protein n=1 Tax=Athelia psychrophila TaxID=1759441 RepID=A0A166VYS2_9AGAM|nr:eEF1-gamma domain-containing protein [Fibularhizoctonia sp. CBS 109695]
MSIGTLWTIPRQRPGKVIRSVAVLGGLQIDLPENYTHYEDNKKPEFLAKFPHGKIPGWEGKDGFLLTEGVPIAKYLASLAPNSGLLGADAKDAALVDQWIHFVDTEVEAPQRIVNQMLSGIFPYLKPIHTNMMERVTRSLTTVNSHLATRTFLVTERITVADLVLASTLQLAVGITVDAELRAKLPNVARHLETIVNQPKLKEIFGETTYVEKALQFVPPKKEVKVSKEAKPAAPKAEKKPKAPAADDDEEDEPLVPAEPKKANPLDALPKSTFNLEDWKRAYSNKETRGAGGALEWFYENFDKDGFSVWRVDFKYPTELTQTFMSSNQIGGFFNRLEASRKYLFGSVGVLGSANDSLISGTFILRGPDVIPVVDVAPDFESYEYKKLDLENADDKAFFESALAWELEIDGKKWADGKNFK